MLPLLSCFPMGWSNDLGVLVRTEAAPCSHGEVPSLATETVLRPRASQHGLALCAEGAMADCLSAGQATAGYWALLLVC